MILSKKDQEAVEGSVAVIPTSGKLRQEDYEFEAVWTTFFFFLSLKKKKKKRRRCSGGRGNSDP